MSRTKQHARKSGLGKRKRDGDAAKAPAAKKQETNRPEQTAYDETISMMDPSLISDHFAKSLNKHSSNSTTLELEDVYIPTRSIRDTTTFPEPHVAKNLPEYLERFSNGKGELSKGEISAPHTLIITISGIRAADLAREVRTFTAGDVKVAKLFAKHLKMAETVAFVQKARINIAVGTPQRPSDLIEQDVLKLDNLKRIVIDGSYMDEKKRTIFDAQEAFLPLVKLLNMEKVKNRLGDEKDSIEILVY